MAGGERDELGARPAGPLARLRELLVRYGAPASDLLGERCQLLELDRPADQARPPVTADSEVRAGRQVPCAQRLDGVFDWAGERKPAREAVCRPEVPREREVLGTAGLVHDADVWADERTIRLLILAVGVGEDNAGVPCRLPEPEQDRGEVCGNGGLRGAEPAEQIVGVADDGFARDVNQVLPADVGAQAVDLERLRVKRGLR